MQAAYGETLAFTSEWEVRTATEALNACARDPIVKHLELGTISGGGYAYLETEFAMLALREFLTVAKLNAVDPPVHQADYPLRLTLKNRILSNQVYAMLEDYVVASPDPFVSYIDRIVAATGQRKLIEDEAIGAIPEQAKRRWLFGGRSLPKISN